jgi:hypothetical protein
MAKYKILYFSGVKKMRMSILRGVLRSPRIETRYVPMMNFIGNENILEVVAREDLCPLITGKMKENCGGTGAHYAGFSGENKEVWEARIKKLRERIGFLIKLPSFNPRRRFTDILRRTTFKN